MTSLASRINSLKDPSIRLTHGLTRSRWIGFFSGLLSGVLIGTSYIPFPPWALLFALVPLWTCWLKQQSLKQIFFSGWITQFALAAIGFHWIAHTAVEFGHLPKPVGWLALLGYASVFNLHIPLAGVVFAILKQKQWIHGHRSSLLTIALLTAIFEQLSPTIFPWNFGYPLLWSKLPAYQWADAVGFHGLSLFVLMCNAGLTLAWIQWNGSPKKTSIRSIFGVLASFLLLNVTGHFREKNLSAPNQKLTVGVVQANIGNFEKLNADSYYSIRVPIFERHQFLTQNLLKTTQPDLVIWPETAVPDRLDPNFLHLPYQQSVLNLFRASHTNFLVGGYSQTYNEGKAIPYNAMFLFDRDAQFKGIYQKTMLLAFGEYFPGSEYFPALKSIVPAISSFGRGPGPTTLLLELEGRKILLGGQICYEGLFADFSRELARKGSQILVNLTNDSWFGTKFEPYQHLYMTAGRAVETRLPLIRSTNTGISALALPNGEIVQPSVQDEEWAGEYLIEYFETPTKTFFVQFGHLLLPLEILSLMLLVLLKRTGHLGMKP